MFEEITLNKLTKTPKKLSRNYRSKNALILITLKKLLESSQNTPRRYFISLLEPELCPLNPKIPNKCLSCPPPLDKLIFEKIYNNVIFGKMS